MSAPWRRPLTRAAKLVLTLLLVAYLLDRVDLREAFALMAGADGAPLAAAFLIFGISVLAGAWQWGRLLAALGIRLTRRKLLELYWVGLFFNNFMPGNVGGDVIKVLDLKRSDQDPVASSAATLADRLTGLGALAFLSFLASWRLSADASLAPLARPVFWGSLVFLGVLALFLLDPVARALRLAAQMAGLLPSAGLRARVLEQLRMLRRRRRLIVQLFLFSLLVQALRVGVHYWVGASLLGPERPGLLDCFLVVPPLAFALILPITLGGLGWRENLAVPLYAPLGVQAEAAVAIQLLAYLLMLLASLLGGLLYLLRRTQTGKGLV